jgi:hypothetical protein
MLIDANRAVHGLKVPRLPPLVPLARAELGQDDYGVLVER